MHEEHVVKKSLIAAVASAALLASSLAAGPAAAHGRGSPSVVAGTPVTVASGLFSPLGLEVDGHGISYVSQNFAGVLSKVDRRGTVTQVASSGDPAVEIAAPSSYHGTVYYAQVASDHSSAYLMAKRGNAAPRQLGNLQRHEATRNPDGKNTYGFVGLPKSCADQFTPQSPIPPTSKGIVDTNPYASLALPTGVYVADAGANAIVKVGYHGKVSTTAVLPPTDPIIVSAELAAAQGLPACVAGFPYTFEPVPTDVELGRDGWLYVSTLPGGPEDPSLGARGGVYKVNPWNGKVVKVATGFGGATGLAVSWVTGNVYVAELFGNGGTGRVSVLTPGSKTPKQLAALASPAAIELRANKLYVTTETFGPTGPAPTAKLTVVPLKLQGKWKGLTEDSTQ